VDHLAEGSSGSLWFTWYWTLGLHKRCRISWQTERLLASQDGAHSKESVGLTWN